MSEDLRDMVMRLSGQIPCPETLKPCPFCGYGDPDSHRDPLVTLEILEAGKCSNCGAMSSHGPDWREEWNRRVSDQDAALEGAHREIERLRRAVRDAIVRETTDCDEIMAVRDDVLRRLRVAEEALEEIEVKGTVDTVWYTKRSREALAKIRGGA